MTNQYFIAAAENGGDWGPGMIYAGLIGLALLLFGLKKRDD